MNHPDAPASMLLTPVEVATHLRVARTIAYRMIADGVIPSVRIGRSVRVPRAQLMAWINQNLRNGSVA